jgi:ABC-type nitrate/sulfonate/bicarbonate transport system permease component
MAQSLEVTPLDILCKVLLAAVLPGILTPYCITASLAAGGGVRHIGARVTVRRRALADREAFAGMAMMRGVP